MQVDCGAFLWFPVGCPQRFAAQDSVWSWFSRDSPPVMFLWVPYPESLPDGRSSVGAGPTFQDEWHSGA